MTVRIFSTGIQGETHISDFHTKNYEKRHIPEGALPTIIKVHTIN